MGFGREAKRVRDTALPAAYRLHALGSCIQLAQPIGFNATWSYLQEKAQCEWRDPRILIPAIDLLESERGTHLGIVEEYVRLRRGQKADGFRFPPRTHATPRDPMRWHGDERVGARHVLSSWNQRWPQLQADMESYPMGHRVVDAVGTALTSTHASVDANELQSALDWARRQIHVVGWEADSGQYRIAWTAHRLLGQLHVLAHGAVPVAAPWNFLAAE